MKRQICYIAWTLVYYWELFSIKVLELWYSLLHFIKTRKPPRKLSPKEMEKLRKILKQKNN